MINLITGARAAMLGAILLVAFNACTQAQEASQHNGASTEETGQLLHFPASFPSDWQTLVEKASIRYVVKEVFEDSITLTVRSYDSAGQLVEEDLELEPAEPGMYSRVIEGRPGHDLAYVENWDPRVAVHSGTSEWHMGPSEATPVVTSSQNGAAQVTIQTPCNGFARQVFGLRFPLRNSYGLTSGLLNDLSIQFKVAPQSGSGSAVFLDDFGQYSCLENATRETPARVGRSDTCVFSAFGSAEAKPDIFTQGDIKLEVTARMNATNMSLSAQNLFGSAAGLTFGGVAEVTCADVQAARMEHFGDPICNKVSEIAQLIEQIDVNTHGRRHQCGTALLQFRDNFGDQDSLARVCPSFAQQAQKNAVHCHAACSETASACDPKETACAQCGAGENVDAACAKLHCAPLQETASSRL